MEKEEIQDGFFIMKWRNFVVMLGSIIIGTNTFTGFIFNQQQNTQQISYNKERSDRKIERQMEDFKTMLETSRLEEQIRERDKEIKELNRKLHEKR